MARPDQPSEVHGHGCPWGPTLCSLHRHPSPLTLTRRSPLPQLTFAIPTSSSGRACEMDPPTHTHHNRTRIRTTSFIAEDNPHFATLAMQFHADRLFSRLDRLSPPRWKSQDELYEEANWKAGMRMTPCTPTPSGTPSPAATPYMFSIDKRYDTPESLSPPPFAHLTKHRGDYPIHSRTQSRKSSKSSISVSKPHRITKRIASKHSMVTRSRCGGNCLRHKSCVRSSQASRVHSGLR